METKRKVAVLIPYYSEADKTFVFLQKRTKDAKILPGGFGFFGGKIEDGETPEEPVKREIREELVYEMRDHTFFEHFEFPTYSAHVYEMKVTKAFENDVKVLEGDYGKWFSDEEVAKEPLITKEGKETLSKFFASLRK